MQRPVMDPMLSMLDDVEPDAGERLRGQLREAAERVWRVARAAGRMLFSKPFHAPKPRAEGEVPDGSSPAGRFVRGLGYRLLFVPIFLALFCAALVYRGTHPVRYASSKLPEVPGVFYETLEFNGLDGYPLMAWFVPVIDAKRVLDMKNNVLHGKQPVVVLVHDFNKSPSQMVPLVAPLHEQGYDVIVVGLRGVGRGRVAAQTFGLNEAVDVRGTLAQIRRRPTVDTDRVAIVGVGTGASAAVIAAAQEPGVKALVLINASESVDGVIAERIGPTRKGIRWLQQASKWAFEMAYHVDADDLQLSRFPNVLGSRSTKSMTAHMGSELSPENVSAIRAFCAEHLKPAGAAAAPVARAGN